MPESKARVWILPVGSEPLGQDGKQLFYGNEDGLGSATPAGFVTAVSFDIEPAEGEPLSSHTACSLCHHGHDENAACLPAVVPEEIGLHSSPIARLVAERRAVREQRKPRTRPTPPGTVGTEDLQSMRIDVFELTKPNGLLDQLEALLPEPVQDATTGTGSHHKVTGSPAPWHPEAAAVLMEVHAGARELEDDLRHALGFARRWAGRAKDPRPGPRGNSDENTLTALIAIPDLAAAAGEPHSGRASKAVARWVTGAREVGDIGLSEPWTPVRRIPGAPAPACPYCATFALRQQARRGLVRCMNRDCTDTLGKRPLGRIEIGAVSGQGALVFRDGAQLTFTGTTAEANDGIVAS
jgi:hypothetical protein